VDKSGARLSKSSVFDADPGFSEGLRLAVVPKSGRWRVADVAGLPVAAYFGFVD
jgi:hypothetical protein